MAPPDHVLPSRWATRETAVPTAVPGPAGYRPCQACLHMHEAAAPGRQVFSLGKMVFGLDIFDG